MARRARARPGPARLGGGARAWRAAAAAAAVAVGALAPLRGAPAAERPRAFAAAGGPLPRRAAAGLGLLLAQPARAEAPLDRLELKTGRSKVGQCELRVPADWSLQEDPTNDGRPQEKRIYAYSFGEKDDGILAVRVDQKPMGPFLRGFGFKAAPEDLVADEWSTVVSGPISQEAMARYLMGIRKKDDKEQSIVDSSMEGNTFKLHMLRRVFGTDGRVLPSRYVSATALLKNGTITTAVLNAPYFHWEPEWRGQYPGSQLDAISQSLRLLN